MMRRNLPLALLATLLLIAGLIAIERQTKDYLPTFLEGTYTAQGHAPKKFSLPFRAKPEAPEVTYEVPVLLPEVHPTLYQMSYSVCLEELTVNGKEVPLPVTKRSTFHLPHCYAGLGIRFDLSDFLHPGRNDIRLRVTQEEPILMQYLGIIPSTMDPLVLRTNVLVLLLIGSYLLLMIAILRLQGNLRFLFLLLGAGTLLRILYLASSPYSFHAPDWQGHVEYIQYLARNFAIPPAQLGWETYHPPLYYAFSAAWLRASEALGRTGELLLHDLQVGSLLLSVGTLSAGLWVGTLLFPKKEERVQLLLFGALLVTFPGLLYTSSRINNDALLSLLLFLGMGLLLRFFENATLRNWIALSITIGAAILTKLNALSLLPIALLTLIAKKSLPPSRKALFTTVFLGILIIITGWFFVLRFGFEGERSLVGNAHRIHPIARVQNSIGSFLSFQPLRVLTHPYAGPIPVDTGENEFLEYFFKSSYFGGYGFGYELLTLSTLMLTAGFLFFFLAIFGFLHEGRRCKPTLPFPLWITPLILLTAHILYRLAFPLTTSQDFRYSILLTIPLCAYAVRGVEELPAWLKEIGRAVLFLHIFLTALFPIALYFHS